MFLTGRVWRKARDRGTGGGGGRGGRNTGKEEESVYKPILVMTVHHSRRPGRTVREVREDRGDREDRGGQGDEKTLVHVMSSLRTTNRTTTHNMRLSPLFFGRVPPTDLSPEAPRSGLEPPSYHAAWSCAPPPTPRPGPLSAPTALPGPRRSAKTRRRRI